MNKKPIKILIGLILAIVIIVGGYFAYAFATYHRIPDNQTIELSGTTSKNELPTNENLRLVSANLGFGAYSDDYSFFMDGGTESWAYSKDAVITNINGSIDNIKSLEPDIIALQEIDFNATRSYHVNELDLIQSKFENVSTSVCVNYDSPFLMYPLTQPHGKSYAGLVTLSNYTITDSIRRSLPIENGFTKMLDLDRCYNKMTINVENGKKLILYNVHLSAYTTDPTTAENQIIMLNEDMVNETKNGNYVIAVGDMNKDLLGDSTKIFNTSGLADNWAAPFPLELLDSSLTLVGPLDETNPVPSCRNANEPYSDTTFVLTVDGFIVSDNIIANDAKVLDNRFKYSDHNPVYLDFTLN